MNVSKPTPSMDCWLNSPILTPPLLSAISNTELISLTWNAKCPKPCLLAYDFSESMISEYL